jgi:hypothetical protein
VDIVKKNNIESKIMSSIDPKLEAIATKVAAKIHSTNKDKYGSIVLILMIISIILTLVRVIQECNKNRLISFNAHQRDKFMHNEMQNICIKRSLFNKWKLKKIIKEKLSVENYKEYGDQLRDAILDTGIDLTEEECFTLVEASKNV